jgi:hypothetical protein
MPDDKPPPTDRDALAAVLEALDIPHAATAGGAKIRQEILNARILYTVAFLRGNLHEDHQLGWALGYLRERLGEHPPAGYVTYEEAQAALREGKSWIEAVTPAEAGEGR